MISQRFYFRIACNDNFSKTGQKKTITLTYTPVTRLIGNYAMRAHKHNNEEPETILCLQIKILVSL
jgi:hypothetical protein